MEKDASRYELIKIEKLIPYINNARTHSPEQIKQIQASIREFGFINPILIDGNFNIIAGHGRVMAAKAEGMDKLPCLFIEHLTEAQKKAYILADNKLAENAGWDMDILKIELEELQGFDFDLNLIGFDDTEISLLFEEPQEAQEDDFDIELPEEPKSKLGDIYQLGRHRLMCGDSTSEGDVDILMDGNKAHMCFTDPPYNVSIGTIKHPKFKQREIENDSMSKDDFKIFVKKYTARIKENTLGCVYIAGPQGEMGRVMFIEADEQMHCSTTIIWNKDQFTLGRGK